MQSRHQFNNCLSLIILSAFTVFVLGCAQKVVTVGSPYERYDHNRTQKIVITFRDGMDSIVKGAVNEVYTPFGSKYFPAAQYKEKRSESDKLPAANVVPIFTGMPLPLSSVPTEEGRSDRDDLIDYLAEGFYKKAGVEPGQMMGDMKSTEITYKPILDFLSSEEQLSGGKEEIIRSLASLNIDLADRVVDSRYNLAASFEHVLAFRYEKYWFILYKLPGSGLYSRLVVVPVIPEGQDFSGKRP